MEVPDYINYDDPARLRFFTGRRVFRWTLGLLATSIALGTAFSAGCLVGNMQGYTSRSNRVFGDESRDIQDVIDRYPGRFPDVRIEQDGKLGHACLGGSVRTQEEIAFLRTAMRRALGERRGDLVVATLNVIETSTHPTTRPRRCPSTQ